MTTAPSRVGSDPTIAVLVEDLTKSYRSSGSSTRHVVLDRIELVVESGECVGIIGPNGAGKSTLLKLIAGVTAPSSGSVRRFTDVRSLIELGVVVNPDLTGRENAEVLAEVWGCDRSTVPEVVQEALSFAGLDEAVDWPVRKYSSGMVARLVFGVATAWPSRLLLVDEVLSVGDLAFKSRCQARLDQLRRDGTTIVLVSHDLDLVLSTCDRVVLLRSNRIESDGDPDRVIRQYLGLPPEDPGAGQHDLQLRATRNGPIPVGDPIQVEVRSQRSGDLHLDLVIPEHPSLVAAGLDPGVVAGWVDVPIEGDQSLRIDTTGLPPLKYELHAKLSHPDGIMTARPFNLVIVGERPELCVAQISCAWRVTRTGASIRNAL